MTLSCFQSHQVTVEWVMSTFIAQVSDSFRLSQHSLACIIWWKFLRSCGQNKYIMLRNCYFVSMTLLTWCLSIIRFLAFNTLYDVDQTHDTCDLFVTYVCHINKKKNQLQSFNEHKKKAACRAYNLFKRLQFYLLECS